MKQGIVPQAFLILCLLFFILAPLWATDEAVLKNIRYSQKEERLEVTIEFSADFSFETFELIGPKRLVIDFSPVAEIKASPVINVNACGVIRIRCGQFKTDVARVVFDLTDKVPSHKISRVEGGLQILFWLEEEIRSEIVVPEVKDEVPPAKKPAIEPVRPTTFVPPSPPTAAARADKGFIQFKAGISPFLSSLVSANKELTLYSETATLAEDYKGSLNLVFGVGLGKYLKVGQKQAKGGVDFFLWSMSHKGNIVATIPHPFLPASPRTFSFEEKLNNSIFQLTAFFLYPILTKERINLWLGPALGYTFGQLTTVEDIYIEDNPPYSSQDIILSGTSLLKENISDFIFEGRLELNYLLSAHTNFTFLASLSYFNPKVPNLGKRAKLLQVPFCLGLEYRF